MGGFLLVLYFPEFQPIKNYFLSDFTGGRPRCIAVHGCSDRSSPRSCCKIRRTSRKFNADALFLEVLRIAQPCRSVPA